jgi:hypothetical protein
VSLSMGMSSSSSSPPALPPRDPDSRIREWSIASRELNVDVGSVDNAMAAGVLDNSRIANARGKGTEHGRRSRKSVLVSSDRIKIS